MINSLATVIQYLKSAGLSTRQIAEEYRYGESWAKDSAGIVVRLDGGTPNLYAPLQEVRLEVRCYGKDALSASDLLSEVDTLSRAIDREPVQVGSDQALLYWINPDSGPSLLDDPTLQMKFALRFFMALVAEDKIN